MLANTKFLSFVFEAGFQYVVHTGLKFTVFLPQSVLGLQAHTITYSP